MYFAISPLQSKAWLKGLVPAKAVDVEVKSKVEQLQVVGDCSENLKIGRKYKEEVFCGISFCIFAISGFFCVLAT